jgi:hypothetical protein
MLWFVSQQRPVEVTLQVVLIYFVRFVIFFILFLVKLVLWVSLLFDF